MAKLRIVSWNCCMNFRSKFQKIVSFYDPDILIIPECETPATTNPNKADEYKKYKEFAVNYQWIPGLIDSKGLGIFAKPGVTLEPLDWGNGGHEFFLPVRVNDTFNLVAVWPYIPYVKEILPYLELNAENINNQTIIAGDFNSSVELDRRNGDKKQPCRKMIALLKEKGLESAYHHKTGEEPGKETTPTFFLHRNEELPFFIDYCFLNPDWLVDIEIGSKEKWDAPVKVNEVSSDHMPIIVDIEIGEKGDWSGLFSGHLLSFL